MCINICIIYILYFIISVAVLLTARHVGWFGWHGFRLGWLSIAGQGGRKCSRSEGGIPSSRPSDKQRGMDHINACNKGGKHKRFGSVGVGCERTQRGAMPSWLITDHDHDHGFIMDHHGYISHTYHPLRGNEQSSIARANGTNTHYYWHCLAAYY
jgi:hypothetical protein